MTNRTALYDPSHKGFTLVELLIVMIILAILSTIVVPAVMKAIALADDHKAKAYLHEVGLSAAQYAGANNQRYPGQDDIGQLVGSSPPGPYTGSQILAARLFGYPDNQITQAHPSGITNNYMAFEVNLLITASGRRNSLADNSKTAKPLLYYPSRRGETTPLGCYKWADNSAYAGGGTSNARFTSYATSRLGNNIARNEGRFLLIGTGANDKYFETGSNNDDHKNWE